jgi:hypothetical protein
MFFRIDRPVIMIAALPSFAVTVGLLRETLWCSPDSQAEAGLSDRRGVV